MSKIKSLSDLQKLSAQLQSKVQVRKLSAEKDTVPVIRVSMATCGIASGAKPIMEYLIDEIEKRKIKAIVRQTGCMGFCYVEPTIEVVLPGQEPVMFGNVDQARAQEIIEKYLISGNLVDGIIPRTYKTSNE